MILCAPITQASFVFIDALSTETGSGFSTHVTWNEWQGISGNYLYSLPFHIHLLLRNHFHDKFCRRAEIILVGTGLARSECFFQLHLHILPVHIPIPVSIDLCIQVVVKSTNSKDTQMPTTLQPCISQKAIQCRQSNINSDF